MTHLKKGQLVIGDVGIVRRSGRVNANGQRMGSSNWPRGLLNLLGALPEQVRDSIGPWDSSTCWGRNPNEFGTPLAPGTPQLVGGPARTSSGLRRPWDSPTCWGACPNEFGTPPTLGLLNLLRVSPKQAADSRIPRLFDGDVILDQAHVVSRIRIGHVPCLSLSSRAIASW
jgi:hypothetical protein